MKYLHHLSNKYFLADNLIVTLFYFVFISNYLDLSFNILVFIFVYFGFLFARFSSSFLREDICLITYSGIGFCLGLLFEFTIFEYIFSIILGCAFGFFISFLIIKESNKSNDKLSNKYIDYETSQENSFLSDFKNIASDITENKNTSFILNIGKLNSILGEAEKVLIKSDEKLVISICSDYLIDAINLSYLLAKSENDISLDDINDVFDKSSTDIDTFIDNILYDNKFNNLDEYIYNHHGTYHKFVEYMIKNYCIYNSEYEFSKLFR